jgi:hypothetical protein
MILKTTFEDGQVLFEDLGDRILLTSKQRSPVKFKSIFDEYFKDLKRETDLQKDCFAFIGSLKPGWNEIPLYTDFDYHLINQSGFDARLWIGGL